MGEVTIRRGEIADIPAVSAMLAQSFENDPEMAAIIPPPEQRPERLQRMFAAQARHHYFPYGAVDLAFAGTQLLGAAMWAAPGHASPPPFALARMVPEYAAALGPHLWRGLRAEQVAQRYHPHYDHWYLYVIGASPAAQGRGVGRALLEHGLARADSAGDAAYLEATTSRSAALYRRLGVVDLGNQPSGTTGMWRPAKVSD